MPRFTYKPLDEPIDGYRLVDLLGVGRISEVWKAVNLQTDRLVAIKFIDLRSSHYRLDLKQIIAFNLVSQFKHPNLVPIISAYMHDAQNRPVSFDDSVSPAQLRSRPLKEMVVVMGLGEQSLSDRLEQLNQDNPSPGQTRGLPTGELLGYLEGAAQGIDYLHRSAHGVSGKDGPVVHCGIWPGNMIIVSGQIQLVDCSLRPVLPDLRMTPSRLGASAAYTPWELGIGKPEPGTDQYGLAISYYELRTGQLPFPDEHLNEMIVWMAHKKGEMEFSDPRLTAGERLILQRATKSEPTQRYPSCTEFVQALRAATGIPARPPVALSSGTQAQPPGSTPADPGWVAPGTSLPPVIAGNPNYVNVSLLGQGGMGQVYLAEHRLKKRKEVLKVVASPAAGRDEATSRFRREIEIVCSLAHPNIVTAYDAMQVGNELVLVMEYVAGSDLSGLVKSRGRLSVQAACAVAQQVAHGLHHAHEKGLVHRDIKPHNLILTTDGTAVKILDFGLAKLPRTGTDQSLTSEGATLGTPAYMAPEQALNAKLVDSRVDIYSLGCTLYFLLSGKAPFVRETGPALYLAHLLEKPVPLTVVRPDVPAELSAVVAKMLAKKPEHRHQTADEVAAALQPFADTTSAPPSAKPPSKWRFWPG